jgi:hypothetical protein
MSRGASADALGRDRLQRAGAGVVRLTSGSSDVFARPRRSGLRGQRIGVVGVLQHDPHRQSDGERDHQYAQGNVHPDPAHSSDAAAFCWVRAPSHLQCLPWRPNLNAAACEADHPLGVSALNWSAVYQASSGPLFFVEAGIPLVEAKRTSQESA